jgi:hypothetical protein
MSKYAPLTQYLGNQPTPVVRMSFEQIERVIGEKLPPSALRHRAWWSNNDTNNVMTRAWLEAGFQSERVDMKARRLVFRRVRAKASLTGQAPAEANTGRHPLIGWMKGTLTVADGVDLTQPADPEWGDVAYGSGHWKDRQ